MEGKSLNGSAKTLNLDFSADDKQDGVDTPRTLSLTEGFEMQDTVGEHTRKEVSGVRGLVVKKAIETLDLSDSSDSEDDSFVAGEQKRLVAAR